MQLIARLRRYSRFSLRFLLLLLLILSIGFAWLSVRLGHARQARLAGDAIVARGGEVWFSVGVTPTGVAIAPTDSWLTAHDFSSSTGTPLGGTTPTTPNANTSGTNQPWQPQSGAPDNVISGPALSFPSTYTNAPAASGHSVALSGNTTNVDRIVINSSGGSYSGAGDLATAYYSLLVQIPAATNLTGLEPHNDGVPNSSSYNQALLASFSDSSGATGGLGTQITGVYLQQGATSGMVDIGIGGNRNSVDWSVDLAPGHSYFLVGSFIQGGTDTSSLWINPTLGLSTAPTATLTSLSGQSGGFNDNSVAVFDVTSNPGLPTAGGLYVGDVRVGTTWKDVTPASAVPEPTSIALVGFGATGLLLAARRRRAAR